jgi:hypothetical protein
MGDDGVLVHMPSDIKAVNTECNQWVTAARCKRQKKTGCMFDVSKGAACGAMNSRDASEIVGNWCDEDGQCLLTPDDIAAMARFNQTPLATRLAKITTGPPLDIAPRATAITPQSLAANWPALQQQARPSNRIKDVREDTAAIPSCWPTSPSPCSYGYHSSNRSPGGRSARPHSRKRKPKATLSASTNALRKMARPGSISTPSKA